MLTSIAPRGALNEYALEALEAVSKADPQALLAGGAVRDTLFNRPIKDIDIFVGPDVTLEGLRVATGEGWEWHGQFSASSVAAYRSMFGEQLIEVIVGFKTYGGTNGVHPNDIGMTDEPPIQIIVMDSPVTLEASLRGFDFGFCQVGLQAADLFIWGTEAFHQDFTFNTATITRGRRHVSYERTLQRAERLQQKYREFPFLDEYGEVILPALPPKQALSSALPEWAYAS